MVGKSPVSLGASLLHHPRQTIPFVILDEVEAALDEANIKRFGIISTALIKRPVYRCDPEREPCLQQTLSME